MSHELIELIKMANIEKAVFFITLNLNIHLIKMPINQR